MATRKVKRFNDGGDAAGYGYGEGAGAAQGAGVGGFGSPGGGYGDPRDYDSVMRDVKRSQSTERGLSPMVAGQDLARDSDAGRFAAPGSGDLGQFAGSSSAASVNAPTNAPPGYSGRVTIPSEESAEYSNAMRDVGALNTRGALSARDRLEARSDAGSFAAPGFGDLGQFAGSFAEGADGRAKGGMMKKYAREGGIMDTKKLKQKDIFTKEMGDPPENNDMGSATKPPKQDMGAGAGRGKQGGPTAKELADYSRKQDQKRMDDTVFREGKKLPKNDDMGSAYAKGGMARDKGKHKMPDGKTMKNSAMVKKYAKGGMVSSASSRGNGIAVRGKTKGRLC